MKKLRIMKRRIILAVVMIVVASFGLYSIQRESQRMNDCANSMSASVNYKAGDVIVGFNEEVTKEDAINLIGANGLTVKESQLWNSIRTLVVSVPEGKEIEWSCRLIGYGVVRYAEVNAIGSIA